MSLALSLAANGVTTLPAAADPVPHDAVVNVDDVGFSPPTVTVVAGGSVTWIERGYHVHTATSLGGAPLAFSTGGFGPYQSRNVEFVAPGTYAYTSATDCLNGNSMPGFTCGVYYVLVVPPGGDASKLPAPAVPAASLPPAPQPTAAPTSVATTSVTVTDSGLLPPVVTVVEGSTVTWTNGGSQVHSVTSSGSVPLRFDSGGLGPGQSSQVSFALPGMYTYSSAPDCLNGNKSARFDCGPYTVTVTAPPGISK